MIGPIGIVLAILLIPVGALIGGGFAAALLGNSLQRDGEARSQESEFADLED